MPVVPITADVRIEAWEVLNRIRRKAYRLFEGDRNRNRTPEPDAFLAKQEGTVQWKLMDQPSR
jgi:hypothetical protein